VPFGPICHAQDQRDALLGRIFGLAAVARSGLILAVPAAAGGADGSSPAAVAAATAAVAEQLSGLLQRKSFLRESAAAALVELLQGLDQQQMAAVLQLAPKTAALLQASPSQATAESLYLALRLWHTIPPQQLQQCELLPQLGKGQSPPPAVFWEQPGSVKRKAVAGPAAAVFSVEQVQLMAPALLLSTASHPRLHPVWGCLLALLVPGFVPVKVGVVQPASQNKSPALCFAASCVSWHLSCKCKAAHRFHPGLYFDSIRAAEQSLYTCCISVAASDKCFCVLCLQTQEQPEQQKQKRSSPEPQQLQNLWQHFVEASCLSSSHERKALALQLLQLLLPVLGPDLVPVLLSKQLLGCVATALKDKESYLHASAKRCLVSSRVYDALFPAAEQAATQPPSCA